MATKNISLPPELARMVDERVASGQYGSASEVVREALRMLFEREAGREWLRKELQIGIDELDRGEGIPASPELFEKIQREGLKRLARRKESA